jgi:hypothetical protein
MADVVAAATPPRTPESYTTVDAVADLELVDSAMSWNLPVDLDEVR